MLGLCCGSTVNILRTRNQQPRRPQKRRPASSATVDRMGVDRGSPTPIRLPDPPSRAAHLSLILVRLMTLASGRCVATKYGL
jgi:hypothetical protein